MAVARDVGSSRAPASSAILAAMLLAAPGCSVDRAPPADLPAHVRVHSLGVMNRSSDEFHGRALRRERWAQMLDADDPGACGLCHAGAPVRPEGIELSAPGATPCTECHEEPAGALACSTCHGTLSGAHAAHVDRSPPKFACNVCHPIPGDPVVSGLHADGAVEVVFDSATVGVERSFDKTRGACAVSCHDHGGARSRPAWNDNSPMGCGDCHGAPPRGHFSGSCTTCHRGANADGTALTDTSLHMNGRVDVGDGSGGCGACHGEGDDPWPKTAAHPSHRDPSLTTPVDCAECHVVPSSLHSPGHLDGVVQVVLDGRAKGRDARPTWNGTRCDQVACHGSGLAEPPAVVPQWNDASGAAKACGACHGAPPSNHTTSTSCDRSTCHGSEVSRDASGRLGITTDGRSVHIDGVVQPSIP